MRKPAIPFVANLTLDLTFFGLTPKYKVQKTEQIFDLIFHSNGAFTYNEVYNMPVYLRIFYMKRLNKYFKDKNKAEQDALKKSKSKSTSRPKFRRR
jgi:hypothetical protein